MELQIISRKMGSFHGSPYTVVGIAFIVVLCLNYVSGITVEIKFPPLLRPKIVGGGNANFGQFPYIVSIHHIAHNVVFCGGAILDDTTILTAAHCIAEHQRECGNNEEDCFKIVAGEYDLRRVEGHEQTVNFSMSDVIVHKNYNTFHQDNDIALIKLKKPLRFSRSLHVKPILLVDPDVEYNTSAYIAGWGTTRYNSNRGVHTLQETTVKIFTDQYCRHQWGDDYHGEGMICAGALRTVSSRSKHQSHEEIVSDACQGDSGGPLMAQGIVDKTEWYVVGIISWGFGCGIPEYPGLYTKVEAYLDWIKENRQSKR